MRLSMKQLKRMGMYFSIYTLFIIGAVMATQSSLWYMIPSIFTISVGYALIDYYARNYDKFND